MKDFTQGKGDGAGLKTGRCHLVKQRLKLVVIVPVNDDNLVAAVFKTFCKFQACKAATYDDDPFFI